MRQEGEDGGEGERRKTREREQTESQHGAGGGGGDGTGGGTRGAEGSADPDWSHRGSSEGEAAEGEMKRVRKRCWGESERDGGSERGGGRGDP